MSRKPRTQRSATLLDRIMAWEEGRMTEKQEMSFFRHLVKSGIVYQLQGMYGRRAAELGLIQ